jgi:hypothetical protein
MALTVPVMGVNSAGLPAAPVNQTTSYTTNGFTTDVTQTQFPLQLGVPLQTNYIFCLIPAALSATCVAQPFTFAGIGPFNITLNSTDQGGGPGAVPIYSTVSSYNGIFPVVTLDCERCINLTSSIATTMGVNATVQALDYRGVPMTVVIPIPIGTTVFDFNFPVSTIVSISISGNPFGLTPNQTMSFGNSQIIGLPYFLFRADLVTSLYWDGNRFNANSVIRAGTPWRSLTAAQIANPVYMGQTYMDNPTRGSIVCYDGITSPNGTAPLFVEYFVAGADSEQNANLANLNQSALGLFGVAKTASGANALPYFVEADLIGAQWNSNLLAGQDPFLTGYANLLTNT